MSKDEFYSYLTESNVEVYKAESKEIDTIFNQVINNILLETECLSFIQDECEFPIDTEENNYIREEAA